MFSIVTDSSADVPLSWLLRGNVHIVPLRVEVKGRIFESKRTAFQEDICNYALKYRGKEDLPKFLAMKARSLPAAVEDFVKVYEKAEEPIISIHISSKLSRTLENAKKAAEQVEKEIYFVDSGTASAGLGILVWHLLNLRDAGYSVKEALEEIKRLAGKIKVVVGIYHPEIVELSPVINFDRKVERFALTELEEKTLKVIDEFDEYSKLIAKMAEIANELAPEMTVISHFCAPKEAQELSMQMIYPSEISEIDLAVSIHVGPRTVAFGAVID